MQKIINEILNEVGNVLNQVNEAEMLKFCNRIQQEKDLSKKIYIAGTGRSGLIGKTFAMRLMHCGLNVYVVGETTTPSIENGDILIIISGSGNTDSLVLLANKANKAGASILLISTNKNSQIGEISSLVLTLPAATKNRVLKDTSLATIQPLGSQFDQSAHILLDAIIVHILNKEDNINNHKSLNARHANLE